MPIETLRPNAAGDACFIPSESGCSACPSHFDCVFEAVADENITMLRSQNALWKYDLYNIPNSGVGAGTINKITLYFRVRCYLNANTVKGAIKSNGTITYTAEKNPTAEFGSGVWHTYTNDWAQNPVGPAAWDWADIDALQIGVALKSNGTAWLNCTQIYVEVDYSPPGWTGKISGVANPAKVMGVAVADIASVKGVA